MGGFFIRFEPIVHNSDFMRAYKKGKNFVHPLAVLYVNRNRAGKMRVGITAGKKLGTAPRRNRAKRVIRAALSSVIAQDMPNVDIVIVARGITADAKSHKLADVLRKMFKKAGLPFCPHPFSAQADMLP